MNGSARWLLVVCVLLVACDGGGGGLGLYDDDGGCTECPALAGVFAADSNVVTIVGSEGWILRTDDGGDNWVIQNRGGEYFLRDVFMSSDSVAVAVGTGGTILRTIDGGVSWVPRTSGTTKALSAVCFADESFGCAVGDEGTILWTTNGGDTWVPQTSGRSENLNGVSIIDASNAVAVGQDSTILRTVDGGTLWTGGPTGEGMLNDVCMVNGSDGTIVGSPGIILHTTTGGDSWEIQQSMDTPPNTNFTGVAFVDPLRGTVVGFSVVLDFTREIITTTNGGVFWNEWEQPFGVPFYNGPHYDVALAGLYMWTVGGQVIERIGGGTCVECQYVDGPRYHCFERGACPPNQWGD